MGKIKNTWKSFQERINNDSFHQNRDIEGQLAHQGLFIGVIISICVAGILFVIEECLYGMPNLGGFATILALLSAAQIYKSYKLNAIKHDLDIIIMEVFLFLAFFAGQICITFINANTL